LEVVRKIRHSKANCSGIVDGCHDTSGISQLFANKYKNLYSSVAMIGLTVIMDNLSVDIDVPIPKNKNGNVTDSANYCGIALSFVGYLVKFSITLFLRNIGIDCALQSFSLVLNVRVLLTLVLCF